MSETHNADPMAQHRLVNQKVDEVHGVFPNDATLQEAVAGLTAAGFGRSRLVLPEPRTERDGIATPIVSPTAPTEDDKRQARTLHTSAAAAAAAMAGAAAVVATGGVAAAAIAAAAGAGAAVGGGVFAATSAVDAVGSAARDAAASRGRLVLAVALGEDGDAAKVEQTMRRAGAAEVTRVQVGNAGLSGQVAL